MVLGVAVGAFAGRLGAHAYGDSFAVPRSPDANQWRIISPGLQEGVGPAGAGRVTHVRNGSLSIATHAFFRPDMVVPLFDGAAHRVDLALAPNSGTLWVQFGDAPSQFVQLKPDAMKGGAAGTAWTPTQGSGRFSLAVQDGMLTVSSGATRMKVGAASPGRVELSAAEDWPIVTEFEAFDATGSRLFSADFGPSGTDARVLNGGMGVGALLGFASAILLVPATGAGLLSVLVGLSMPLLVATQPDATWLLAVERLYLKDTVPSQWATTLLMVSLFPAVWFACLALIRRASTAVKAPLKAPLLWCLVGVFSAAVGVRGFSPGLWIGAGCMALGAARAGSAAPDRWWAIDALGWLPLAFFGPESGAIWMVVWRASSLIGTAALWKQSARRAVDGLVLAVCLVPFALESSVSESALGGAWQMEELSGERPNERGWQNPVPVWEDACGSGSAKEPVTVVFAGGSSVGGAYQFGDEPEAFFPAATHRQLCVDLPEGQGLRTVNFGDGDRNTFTISRSLDSHLERADVLVMYVGVNDVLTRQNARTRKEREEAVQQRGQLASSLSDWASDSTVMVGLSLWNRGLEDPSAEGVADVPLADAKENHAAIIAAARSRGVRVVLLTEHVRGGLQDALRPYARMQRGLVSDDVVWLDAEEAFAGMPENDVLVDRNHLSREGNAALGRHIASQLVPLVYGSSL